MSLPPDFQPSGYHRFCMLFPAADETDFQNIVNSMKAEGYYPSEPVTLFGTEILDGRTRYEASVIAGVQPTYSVFTGTEKEAYRFVFLKNFARRHLTDSQRAALAALIPDLTSKERAEMAGVHLTMQNHADKLASEAPEFLEPAIQGKATVHALQPVTKDPDVRKQALQYLQRDDIEGLLALLRGGSLRSFQEFKGTVFDIKRSREIGSMVKFNNIFSEVQRFLNQLDGIVDLVNELKEAKKGYEQKHLWVHFVGELKSIIPDIQARMKRTIQDDINPCHRLLKIWDGILADVREQSRRFENREHFTLPLVAGQTQYEQAYELLDKFLNELLQVAVVMSDDSVTEFTPKEEQPKQTKAFRKFRKKFEGCLETP